MDPRDIKGSVRRRESIGRVKRDLPEIEVTTDNAEVVRDADVIFLTVKPNQAPDALLPIKDLFRTDQLVISLIAGISTRTLELIIPSRVIRAMTNIAITVGKGVTAVSPGSRARESDIQLACSIFDKVGECMVLDERLMDVFTAIAGSGPAFLALILEGFWEAALYHGVPTDDAWRLVLATFESAIEALKGRRPWEVIEEVTTPGGVTIRGIKVAEERGLRGLLMDIIERTVEGSREISREVESYVKARLLSQS